MSEFKLGILGGTALLDLELTDQTRSHGSTPFGQASANPIEGKLPNGHTVVLIPRHGQHHQVAPSQVNYRANLYTLKRLGVTHVLSISAVGSLQENIQPGKDVVIPDQLFDATKGLRARTFFEKDLAVHVPMGTPFCEEFRHVLLQTAAQCDVNCIHHNGTYVTIEGPQFSTAAESKFYRNCVPGAAVIGMTAIPEAALAREAGLCYGVLALPADYDAWRDGEEAVTADAVKEGLSGFGNLTAEFIQSLTEMMHRVQSCGCAKTLEGFAVHTAMKARYGTEANRLLGVPLEN